MEQFRELQAEAEKKKKTKKKGTADEPELREEDFKFLNEDIVRKMLKERMAQEDCNAGVIFDQLECQYWPDLQFALKVIVEAVPKQNIQLLLLKFNKEREAEEAIPVCTNYRLARRRMQGDGGSKEEGKPAKTEAN